MITTGVTGGYWRATVTPYGGIVPAGSDGAAIDWHIAADDRWHSPALESTVRQRRVDGTAVVETRVRVPDGDAVQRVYSVADHGGLTIIEVENESPLPIAVAFTSADLLSQRPPTAPIEGIALPSHSVAFPVGHRATLTVALPHRAGAHPASLPSGLPTSAAVARGWLNTVEQAGRVLLPDADVGEFVVATRCELALCGPPSVGEDPAGFVLVVDQMVRMGEVAEPWVPHVAHAVELAARAVTGEWVLAAALSAADRVFAAAADDRARRDLAALGMRLRPGDQAPPIAPVDPERALAWHERRIVTPGSGARLLDGGLPANWLGINFEVFDLPVSGTGKLSMAIRWHGDRPAVLWEQSPGADGPVTLTAPVLAPEWSSADLAGEALWPQYSF